MLPSDPLTDDELDELDRFLLNVEGVDDSMDSSRVDGYIAAILAGPKTIVPSDWMRRVSDTESGEESPAYESLEQAQRSMALLMRCMNHVAATLIEAPEDYEPWLIENPTDGHPRPVVDEWCTGGIKGIRRDAAG